jgi:DNA-binding NarL/FixJ family response regulator
MAIDAIRVLIAGGTTLGRAGLRRLVEGDAQMHVIAESSDLSPADDAGAETPDIVLLDIDDAPAVLLRQLESARGRNAERSILVLTSARDPEMARRVVLAGARGVVFKDRSPEHLLTALRKVHEGELWIDRLTSARLIADIAVDRGRGESDRERAKIALLTRRERDVVALVSVGLNNKAIAIRLGISDTTVRHHLTSIFAKLDVPDRLALVVYAFQRNLARPL